jgi:hypothetical protein
MYRMMYKTKNAAPTFIESVKDKEEFLSHRALLAQNMGFVTEIVNDKLFIYDEGKEFGVYYGDDKSV